ncbi:MAG: BufA2 family periplasmic bufferin-type metallophore [Hyphomicrobium sp.]
MKISAKSGASIATAAAALFLAGAVVSPVANAAEEAKGHCMGANACKGTGACKTANNACAGKNACKGTGFTAATKAECEAAAAANKDEKVKISFEAAK